MRKIITIIFILFLFSCDLTQPLPRDQRKDEPEEVIDEEENEEGEDLVTITIYL